MFEFPVHSESSLFSQQILSLSVVGTLHDHRSRWNPFTIENEMTRLSEPGKWMKLIRLSSRGGRHRDGVYSFRFVVNHNPKRWLKLSSWMQPQIGCRNDSLRAQLISSYLGRASRNLTIRVREDCEACLVVDEIHNVLDICCSLGGAVSYVDRITSVQINGFIWDGLDMFEKFNERAPNREMVQMSAGIWGRKIPLTVSGGIDFRADGVYQLLISANGDEDQGYSALNYDQNTEAAIELVQGTGFGSSHGTSYHSAPTVRVLDDDVYEITVALEDGKERLMIRGASGGKVELINNQAAGIQLLGDIHPANGFDPTQSQSQMNCLDTTGQIFEKIVQLESGVYSINFAIGAELFLDTMGLGCWIETSGELIRGVGWHGKPNESNIGFRVTRRGSYRFSYNRSNDIFCIESASPLGENPACLEAVTMINSLSIVGNLPVPQIAWDPTASENLMTSLGRGRFEKLVSLEKGTQYEFKFVGNQTNWQIVFADYELDGYGLGYGTTNPDPYNSTLTDLRLYGQLTTHGNPPPIQFTPSMTAKHLVLVDLWSGAYGIKPI